MGAIVFEVVSPDDLPWVDEDADGLIDIRTIDDLYRLSLEHARDTFDATLGFELVSDLDFEDPADYKADTLLTYLTTDEGWLPIGSNRDPFKFQFEGNDNFIANLFIDRNASYLGLFGATTDQSTISNLHLTDLNINGDDFIGGLVGFNAASIRNCSVIGDIFSTGSSVGLLIGRHNQAEVVDSYTSGGIISNENSIGGLIGSLGNASSDVWLVERCFSTAIVRGGSQVGGLIGSTNWGNGSIYRCYAKGNVLAQERSSGGLIGELDYGTVNACYATGEIRSNSFYVGGLIGTNTRTVVTSYSIGEVTGSSNTGGLVGRNSGGSVNARNYWDVLTSDTEISAGDAVGLTTNQLQGQTTSAGIYITWDQQVWDFGTSSQYPALKNMPGGLEAQRN